MSLIPLWNICSVFCTQLVIKIQVTRKHRVSCLSLEYNIKPVFSQCSLFPCFSFLTTEGSNSVFSVLGFFSRCRVEPLIALLRWDVARGFLLEAAVGNQETHDPVMSGHNLLDENASIKSGISNGKEEYFYCMLFWYQWGMEPQQNNRIKTTFLIKSPVRVIPPMLITFSSGCMCIARTHIQIMCPLKTFQLKQQVQLSQLFTENCICKDAHLTGRCEVKNTSKSPVISFGESWWQEQSLGSFTIVHRRIVWAPQLLADRSRAAHLPQGQLQHLRDCGLDLGLELFANQNVEDWVEATVDETKASGEWNAIL